MPAKHTCKKTKQPRHKLEWMLRAGQTASSPAALPSYGTLAGLNTSRRILNAVGEKTLAALTENFLDLLGSSAAIYEANGDYASEFQATGWCRLLSNASRNLCGTGDNTAALRSGKWLCHEACWHSVAKIAIAKQGPVDIACDCGISHYGVPVLANGEVVGAMTFAYGETPASPRKLQKIAERYQVDADELARESAACKSRPPFIVDLAKKQLLRTATILQQIIEGQEKEDFRQTREELGQLRTELLIRNRAEKELRRNEERFRDLIESASDIIQILQPDGRFLFVNRSWEETLGYSPEELANLSIFSLIDPDCGEYCKATFRKVLCEGRVDTIKTTFVAKNGRKIILEGSANCKFEAGTPQSIRCIFRNVTEQKKLEAQFLQSQKMEAIGRLAGGVAHDFNNLLTTIIGYSDIVLRQLPDMHPLWDKIEAINSAGKKSAALTRQLLAFSRKQVLEMKSVNLNKVIRDLSKMMQRLLGEDVELKSSLEEEISAIMADPVQLEQILMNLAVNSRDAMPNGGELLIETAGIHVDDDYVKLHKGMKPGEYALLSVTDTGEGMTREVQEQIFEPFFTTKEEGKGTGLGLATIYGIVKQHNGYIYVNSGPGRGTSFKIFFPVTERFRAYPPVRLQQDDMPPGNATILVVDDSASVRQVISDTLQPLGYKIFEAANGKQALELCSRLEEPVNLLLTDVIMPKMNGPELAQRLQQSRPETKIIFMSGYAKDVLMNQGVLKNGFILLDKPLSPASLANMLRLVLTAGHQ
ncbi:MAG: response regulator [Deltaproteobacteria bacterium]|nr:response regulator [Deltaproteobacteria bacterium]